MIRAVQLPRYLSHAPLRRRVTAATNEVEAFNGFSQWIGFGNGGGITDNDPVEQEKTAKFNALLTNEVIFHNTLDIAEIVRQLLEEGWKIDPEDLAHIPRYLTEHIKRFGEYSTHELRIEPEAYDPKLDVGFTLPRRGSERRRLGPGRMLPGEAACSPVRAGRCLYRAGCARGDDAGAESSGGLGGNGAEALGGPG
ncbi:hypothetical protein GCM10010145_17620 [Streptomyces ruber]|uniref:Tn3 transposase DDE domain-containing protein n=2 Tax=Streptomyces TaxID=1883 RepID=A0A918EQD6_9ACTN|nr:hypothetical protein GCM10010145_17620 [Streptomyces ruber]